MQPHVKAKELIAGGAIAKVLTFKSHFCHAGPDAWTGEKNIWFFDKSKASFGVIADLGIHKTDVLSYIISQKFTETTTVLQTIDKKYPDRKPIDVDNNALCIYRTAEGVLCLVSVSWTNYGTAEISTVIKGTDGILRIYTDEQYPLILERQGETVRYQFDDPLSAKSSGVIDEFIASIEEKRETLASGSSALHGMMAIFASAQSAE